MKRIIYFLSVGFISVFAILIIKNPQICVSAISNGLVLCAAVIIPSLYPFTFCVLFIMNSNLLNSIKFANRFTKKIFGMQFGMFVIFIISLIGGYPLGAKLINDSVSDKNTAGTMLNFCVNAGPAFIITAVGTGIYGSQKIGLLLFFSHIIPSFLLCIIFRKRLKTTHDTNEKHISLSDNFVLSATAATSSLINICGFVLLFSVICSYANNYTSTFPLLKPLCMLLEVTNGINMTRNIFAISFLLGFGGICIWCQVLSVAKNANLNIWKFSLCRIFHGSISSILTYCGIKIFNITIPAISNGKTFEYSTFTDTAAVGVSLIIMGIVLIVSLKNKNYAGNIIEDIV